MKEQNRKKNKKSGFTLVELVVVIAIIGILAAVVVPRVRTALYKARDAKAMSVLDAIRTASNVYFTENGKSVSSAWEAQTGTKTAAIIAYKDLVTLKNKALIDQKTLDLLKFKTATGTTGGSNDDPVFVEVGSAVTISTSPVVNCEDLTKGWVQLGVGADGVDVVFRAPAGITETNLVDSSCNPWVKK